MQKIFRSPLLAFAERFMQSIPNLLHRKNSEKNSEMSKQHPLSRKLQ